MTHVNSTLILPGNKFILFGTKEGELCLYDNQLGTVIQTIDAHRKEIWQIAMHTNPQVKKGKGQLLIATASGDKTIKFWNLSQSSQGEIQLVFNEKIESTDEIMGVKFTHDGKYFVFSLLD